MISFPAVTESVAAAKRFFAAINWLAAGSSAMATEPNAIQLGRRVGGENALA